MEPVEVKTPAELPAELLATLATIADEINASLNLDEVLARIGRTADQLKERETAEMRRATYRVPRGGAVGTAANYALHLARC